MVVCGLPKILRKYSKSIFLELLLLFKEEGYASTYLMVRSTVFTKTISSSTKYSFVDSSDEEDDSIAAGCSDPCLQ